MQNADSLTWSCIGLLSCSLSACIVDTMPPDIYANWGDFDAAVGVRDATPQGSDEEAPPPGADDDPAAVGDASTGDAGGDFEDVPPPPGCDLRGSWLITERLVASGLGAQQAAVYWLYYELEQSGEQLRVKKGLVCGTAVQPIGAVSATVDMHGAWPKLQEKNPHTGRTGSSKAKQPTGCSVALGRAFYVMGATMPYYKDKSRPLPTLEQAASESSPGWEDWDSDGKPGISLHVSGLANGVRYGATRTSNEWAGEIKSGSSAFKLRSTWQQDEAVYGVTSDILKSTGTRDADPTLHFAQFARLSEGQVSGDDFAICKEIRKIAAMLTPEANL